MFKVIEESENCGSCIELKTVSQVAEHVFHRLDEGAKHIKIDSVPEPECSIDGMSFGQAIVRMKAGNKVARSGWNGKGMWIALMDGKLLPARNYPGNVPKVNENTARFIGEDANLNCQPYIAMMTAQGEWQPGWVASQADMLANDWLVVIEL